MSKHNKIGIKGEQIAEGFLLNNGYSIINRNWRAGKKEVDIIALAGNMVVFVEVKTRSGTKFLFPEEAVNYRKQQYLKAAAVIFMDTFPQYVNIRFDIISIVMNGEAVKEIMHFEEAFH